MKWISDDDEQRLRTAQSLLWQPVLQAKQFHAHNLIEQVLANIQRLAQEQPHPAPRIRELSEAEQRVFYPERHK